MASAKLGSYLVHFQNGEEYHRLKQEVFTQDIYYFETDNPTPVIIDAGAHIGLATLYFKRLFPAAQITAIEPHPETVRLLETNIFANHLADVTIVPAALHSTAKPKTLYADKTPNKWLSTAGFTSGAWNRTQTSESLKVPAIPLSLFLDQPIDFLKMDIEGAEQAVLEAAGEKLKQVKHMIIEFHPISNQSALQLVTYLTTLGFTVKTWKKGKEINVLKTSGLFLIEAVAGD